jgi:hypothetical protein
VARVRVDLTHLLGRSVRGRTGKTVDLQSTFLPFYTTSGSAVMEDTDVATLGPTSPAVLLHVGKTPTRYVNSVEIESRGGSFVVVTEAE